MLSEEVLDLVTERIVNRIEAGNTYVIEKIGRDIKEIGTLSDNIWLDAKIEKIKHK